MKIQILNWGTSKVTEEKLEILGFKNRGYYEIESLEATVKTLHSFGLNVMLPFSEDIQHVIVDHKFFTQR